MVACARIDFYISHHASHGVQGQGQERQRLGRELIEHRAGGHDIVETISGILAEHFINRHSRTVVRGIGVLN